MRRSACSESPVETASCPLAHNGKVMPDDPLLFPSNAESLESCALPGRGQRCPMRRCRLTPVRASNTCRPSGRSIRTARCPRLLIRKGPEAGKRVFSIPARSCSIWQRKAESSLARRRTGRSCCPGCSLSPRGLGPFSGQAVHFQFAAPEGLDYARNRYRREAERHYQVLEDHLAGRDYFVGNTYTIADISTWGWIDRASRVLKGEGDPLAHIQHQEMVRGDRSTPSRRSCAGCWNGAHPQAGT